jgi:galactosamine-6-phosphate isomerase
MLIIISETHEASSQKAADKIAVSMYQKNNPLICVASGDSPAGIYRNFVEKVQNNAMNISQWTFLGLDEWVGLNGNDEGSCRYHLNAQLFSPLNIANDQICFFDGASQNLVEQCQITEATIQQHGGIELAILGLGMNGHIGMNEPNTSALTRSHIIELDPITAQVGQKYFQSPQTLSKGITLGIASLLESKTIILIVSGEKKAAIVKQVLEGEITEKIPASILRKHPNCYIYLDQAAASLLDC